MVYIPLHPHNSLGHNMQQPNPEFADFKENPEVKNWLIDLGRRSKATAKSRAYYFFHYFKWVKANKGIQSPSELLARLKQLKREEKEYEHIDWIKEYLFNDGNIVKSLTWREGTLASIRGFYRFNRSPLPDEKIDLSVREEDAHRLRELASLKTMTLEDFRKLLGPAKIREKSTLLTMLQSGMGVGELTKQFNVCTCRPEYLKQYGHCCASANVLKQLREGKQRIKIEPLIAFKRRGNDKKKQFFTFIGKDAVECLRQYLIFRKKLVLSCEDQLRKLEQRNEEGHYLHAWEKLRIQKLSEALKHITPELRDGEPIYITNLLQPIGEHSIQQAVRILKKQTGLLDRQFTPHTCRDIFKTECHHAGVQDKISEFWIRHKLDNYGYNQLDVMHPEDFDSEYGKVEPALNILSGVSTNKIASLESQLREKEIQLNKLHKRFEEVESRLGKLSHEFLERDKADIVRYIAARNPTNEELHEFLTKRGIDVSLLQELSDERFYGCVHLVNGRWEYEQQEDKIGYGY